MTFGDRDGSSDDNEINLNTRWDENWGEFVAIIYPDDYDGPN